MLWCLVSGRKRYPVLISDSFDQAASLLEGLKAEIEANPRLAQDFPDFTGAGPVWQVGVVVTKTGAKIQTAGSGKKLRGFRHGAQRPDLVVLDDIENDENVRTPEQRDKLEAWVDKAVDPLGPPDGSMDIIFVNTFLHHDSVARRKSANPMGAVVAGARCRQGHHLQAGPPRLAQGRAVRRRAPRLPRCNPVAFVVPLAAAGGANHLVTGIRQGIAERVGVVIFLRRHGDARAVRKAEELEDLYRRLRGALIGWAPSDDYDPMLFVHGSLSDLGNNEVMWMEEFTTGYYHG